MPMVWDPAAEAKLLSNIFKICDVKVSEPQKQELAKIMGPDCTAKAITHRIAKIKGGASSGEKAKPAPAAKKATPKGKGKKRSATPEEDDEEQTATPPPSGRGEKRRRIKKEPSEDGIEMGEDIGEGLRKGKEDESEDEF